MASPRPEELDINSSVEVYLYSHDISTRTPQLGFKQPKELEVGRHHATVISK